MNKTAVVVAIAVALGTRELETWEDENRSRPGSNARLVSKTSRLGVQVRSRFVCLPLTKSDAA